MVVPHRNPVGHPLHQVPGTDLLPRNIVYQLHYCFDADAFPFILVLDQEFNGTLVVVSFKLLIGKYFQESPSNSLVPPVEASPQPVVGLFLTPQPLIAAIYPLAVLHPLRISLVGLAEQRQCFLVLS